MERRRPIQQLKSKYPVNIYKREELLAECSSIQAAARFFKEYTQDTQFRWTPIHRSLWYDEPYSINGDTYYFTTDPEVKENKLKELGEEIK